MCIEKSVQNVYSTNIISMTEQSHYHQEADTTESDDQLSKRDISGIAYMYLTLKTRTLRRIGIRQRQHDGSNGLRLDPQPAMHRDAVNNVKRRMLRDESSGR